MCDKNQKLAKWTRLLISAAMVKKKAEAFDYLQKTLDFISSSPTKDYPRNELYYLIVVAWNEGITRLQ